jgi:hypothetical protein
MANTYVTDLRHYLDDDQDLAEMSGPALNLAIRGWEHSLWDRRRGPA